MGRRSRDYHRLCRRHHWLRRRYHRRPRRQPVDAADARLENAQERFGSARCVVFPQGLALGFEHHLRHRPTARGLCRCYGDVEDLPHPGLDCKMARQFGPAGILRQHWNAAAIKPIDQRRLIEGAEHDGDAAIGEQMRVGLVPGTTEIKVCDAVRAEHAKAVHALWRQVDPGIRRRRSDKEHRLRSDENAVLIGDLIEELGHFAPFMSPCRPPSALR